MTRAEFMNELDLEFGEGRLTIHMYFKEARKLYAEYGIPDKKPNDTFYLIFSRKGDSRI